MNKTNHAFVNQLLVYTLVMICLSGSVGLGTVWLRHQISLTANQTKQLVQRIAETERRLAELNALINTEQSADALGRRNVEWSLGLTPPKETQVVRVSESPERRLAMRRNAENEIFVELPTPAQNVTPVRFRLAPTVR